MGRLCRGAAAERAQVACEMHDVEATWRGDLHLVAARATRALQRGDEGLGALKPTLVRQHRVPPEADLTTRGSAAQRGGREA